MVIEIPSPPPPAAASTNSMPHTGQRPGSVVGGTHIMGQIYRLASPSAVDLVAPVCSSPGNQPRRMAKPMDHRIPRNTRTTIAPFRALRPSQSQGLKNRLQLAPSTWDGFGASAGCSTAVGVASFSLDAVVSIFCSFFMAAADCQCRNRCKPLACRPIAHWVQGLDHLPSAMDLHPSVARKCAHAKVIGNAAKGLGSEHEKG